MRRFAWLFGWWLLFGGFLASNPLWAADISLAERKNIVVSPPRQEAIVVPEQYRGPRVEIDKYGKPFVADHTAEYQSGFLSGWSDFLEQFQHGDFDLDEAMNPARFPDYFARFVGTQGPSAFNPGQVAGMAACRDELLALAKKRHLTFLPVRTPWVKRLNALGAADPELNDAGNPTHIIWAYTTKSMQIRDEDLQLLRDVSVADVKQLSLPWTSITDAGVANLPSMPQLTHLEITGKNLTNACFHALDKFPRLTNLTIQGPRAATADDLAEVKKLSGLERLDIGAIEIGDDALPVLLALPKLTDLRLNWAYDGSRGPKLSPSAIARLGGCGRLKLLSLNGCAVDDAALKAIAESQPELFSLSLASTLVTDESIGSIQKLPKLEWLRLSHTRITDAGIATLASHPSIKTLLLDDTRISDQALATFATMPKLKEISVRRSQLSEAGIASFKKLKPDAYVIQYD